LAARPVSPTAPAVAAVPEDSSSAPVLGAPATARLPVPEGSAAAAPPRPVLSRLAAGFVLQAGVFTSTERAEELKAKLLLAGVPVTIETRVQVGPFASQKEANAARKKIRELGVESILIPPRAGRR
jgi:DedD protein